MTRTYTAADFANARFAEHPDGRTAMWVTGDYGQGEWQSPDDVFDDEEMAREGWVPVPSKPTITESQFSELSEDLKNRTTILACALERVGIKITPDPEPTNTDKLVKLIDEWQEENGPGVTLAEWLDEYGVTAPNVKGN